MSPLSQSLATARTRTASAWAALDPSQRVFTFALGVSLLLHALVLSIHFTFPNALRKFNAAAPLEVVLVNSKSRSRPAKADVMAQANLDGGGNTDADRRLKTPLPVLRSSDERGQDLDQATRRVQELEELQRQLLTQMQQGSAARAPSTPAPKSQPDPQQISGAALANRALASIQREAQISRDIDDYNKRPRKLFVGARAQETSTALYVDAWRQKVERLGSINYPDEARGKLYGSLQLTVTINADGSVAAVELDRSSGYGIIDAAAQRIVRMGAPYAALPTDLRRNFEQLVITRTWSFVRGDRVVTD